MFARISFLCLIFSLFSINVANSDEITSEFGKIIKEKREIPNFTKIVITSSGHLFLKQGSSEALTIETDSNLLSEIKSEVKNAVLHLGLKEPVFRPNHPINYYLTVKNIEDIQSEGGIEISSDNTITAKQLNLVTEGAGKVDLKVKIEKLAIRVEGAGDVKFSGTATDQILKIEGAGNIQGKKLMTKTTRVEISGAGIAEVNASEVLDVKIEGVGTVKYYGQPKITQEISGAGEIIPLG